MARPDSDIQSVPWSWQYLVSGLNVLYVHVGRIPGPRKPHEAVDQLGGGACPSLAFCVLSCRRSLCREVSEQQVSCGRITDLPRPGKMFVQKGLAQLCLPSGPPPLCEQLQFLVQRWKRFVTRISDAGRSNHKSPSSCPRIKLHGLLESPLFIICFLACIYLVSALPGTQPWNPTNHSNTLQLSLPHVSGSATFEHNIAGDPCAYHSTSIQALPLLLP